MTGIEPAYSAWEYLDAARAKPTIGTALVAAKKGAADKVGSPLRVAALADSVDT
jgi:hypothetical protein